MIECTLSFSAKTHRNCRIKANLTDALVYRLLVTAAEVAHATRDMVAYGSVLAIVISAAYDVALGGLYPLCRKRTRPAGPDRH